MSADDQERLFDHLLVTADAHRDTDDALLRRQATYLLGFDKRTASTEWLAAEQLRASRHARTDHLPSWVAIRSSAIALARNGNTDPLQLFVADGLTNETQDVANLKYWAYWIGEVADVQGNDSFMRTLQPGRWTGARLFHHLVNRLRPGSHHAELTIHSLWTLLAARPAVLTLDPTVRATAKTKIEQTIGDSDLTAQTRQKLASVAYAIRIAER